MSEHAFLPPSAASSWSLCAQWATMNAKYPREASAEATEGTAAHWCAWEILASRECKEGTAAPNGQIVTEEMLDAADLLVETIRMRIPAISILHIEQLVPIPYGNGNFGTPDVWAVSTDRTHIEIIDYKYGHRFVDEWWNAQGLCYLAGIVELLSREWKIGPGMMDQFDISVSFTVVQPRCYYKGKPVRTHTFKLAEARSHFNQLANMAEAATLREPVAMTNVHCIDCPGRHSCSALQLAAYSDAELSSARSAVDLSPQAAALELRFLSRSLERLEARVDGLKEMVIANLKAGRPISYFRLEPGFGRKAWKIPDAQVISIGELFGANLSKIGVITPTQAKKLGIDEAVIEENSFTPSTTMKLVAENPADARKVFGQSQE
jgi:hypothetical protein